MSFNYSLRGQHAIILDAEATSQWSVGCLDEIKAVAQARANDTGHACEVFSFNAVDILYAVQPAPKAPVPQQLTLFGGVASWLARNVTDPEDSE